MRLCALILFVLQAGLANSQVAEIMLDTNRILIGDQVRVSITLICKAQASVQWPQIGDTLLTEIEVLSQSSIDTAYESSDISNKLLSQELIITSFDSGYYAIPPLHFKVNGTLVKSNPFLLYVGNVLLEGEEEIKDIKDIIPVEYGLLDWLKDYWLFLLSGLLLLLLSYFLIKTYLKRRANKEAKVIEKPKIPAHVTALSKLKALEEKRLWQNEQIKAYHSELTDIIREFLEGRFQIHAMEQTSEEILLALRFSELLEVDKKKLRQILLLADLVKFAKEKPLPAENEESLLLAYQLVEAAKEKEETKSAEEKKHVE